MKSEYELRNDCISMENALLIRDLGFPRDYDDTRYVTEAYETSDDYPTYYNVGDMLYCERYDINRTVSAPTRGIVMKWLRNEFNVHISISLNNVGRYYYRIFIIGENRISNPSNDDYKGDSIYDNVVEKAISKAIKIIKIHNLHKYDKTHS